VQQSAAVGGPLKLEGVIRTYRYLDEDEQAQLAAAEDAAAKTQNNARRR
jgi:Tfp pilus assembly protein PilO